MSSTGKRIEKAFTKTGKKSKITIPKKYISFAIVAILHIHPRRRNLQYSR